MRCGEGVAGGGQEQSGGKKVPLWFLSYFSRVFLVASKFNALRLIGFD